MSVYIKDMEMPKQGMVVNIYAGGRVTNHFDEFGKTIGEAVSIPPHGRLIDADEFLHRAIGTKCFDEDYVRMLQELVGESITIIPAEESE